MNTVKLMASTSGGSLLKTVSNELSREGAMAVLPHINNVLNHRVDGDHFGGGDVSSASFHSQKTIKLC